MAGLCVAVRQGLVRGRNLHDRCASGGGVRAAINPRINDEKKLTVVFDLATYWQRFGICVPIERCAVAEYIDAVIFHAANIIKKPPRYPLTFEAAVIKPKCNSQ